jgi:transposase
VAPQPRMEAVEARMEPKRDCGSGWRVTEGAVSQWMKMAREQGEEGLRGKIAGGRASRLTKEQLQQLPRLLEQGAQAYGFAGAVWRPSRVAVLIYQQFRVRYHPAHMSRLLKAIHYSVQQPIQRASQRDERAIQTWKEERWPALKKKAQQEDRTMVFVDEAGWYLLPMEVAHLCPGWTDKSAARPVDA